MNKEDLHALTVLGKKFAEYTADNYKKARGKEYICDSEIHYLFDYMHKDEPNYIGITTRFLYNENNKQIVGFEVCELFKGANFVEGVSKINDGIEIGTVHNVAFCGGFKTVKICDRFDIERINISNKDNATPYVEIL